MSASDTEKGGADNQRGPPPSYSPDMPAAETYGSTDAVPPPAYSNTGNLADQPPSYDSLYGRVQKAQEESSGHVDFFKKFFIIILSTVGCTIFVGLVLAIPITSIVLGSMHLHDCPIERYIPIYLIVAGVFGVIKGISDLAQRIKKKQDEDEDGVPSKNPFDGIVGCFLMAWFIAGNVWIYRVYNDVKYDPSAGNRYCQKTLYLYAFWSTTAVYILIATTCCCFCCVGICAACFGKKSSN